MSLDTIPAIYCGTYHKYNCRSIFGKWFKLNEFANCDEFLDACRELHSDEEDPDPPRTRVTGADQHSQLELR